VVKRQRCCTGTARGAALSILHDFFILTHEYLAVFRKADPAAAAAPPAAPLWRPIAGVPGLLDPPVTDTLTTAVAPCERCNPATALAAAPPPSSGDRAVVNGWALQTATKTVPVVPLAGRNRVLGTVWTFQASDVAGLHRLATAQLVRGRLGEARFDFGPADTRRGARSVGGRHQLERFGDPETCYEEWAWVNADGPSDTAGAARGPPSGDALNERAEQEDDDEDDDEDDEAAEVGGSTDTTPYNANDVYGCGFLVTRNSVVPC